jgi:hypothetical protein
VFSEVASETKAVEKDTVKEEAGATQTIGEEKAAEKDGG